MGSRQCGSGVRRGQRLKSLVLLSVLQMKSSGGELSIEGERAVLRLKIVQDTTASLSLVRVDQDDSLSRRIT